MLEIGVSGHAFIKSGWNRKVPRQGPRHLRDAVVDLIDRRASPKLGALSPMKVFNFDQSGSLSRSMLFYMFSWVNYYRRLAEEAQERASQAVDPSVQATFKELAKDWRARLEQAEQRAK